MTLTFVNLIPIFLVFILYFLGMPIVYELKSIRKLLTDFSINPDLFPHTVNCIM